MKLIAKATLGALALATLGFGAANAAVAVQIGPNGVAVEQTNPCLRAPELRPGFCFGRDARDHDWRDRMAFNQDRDDWRMREHLWRERERERQAYEYGHAYGHDWDMR